MRATLSLTFSSLGIHYLSPLTLLIFPLHPSLFLSFFFFMILRPPKSTLFPHTSLFFFFLMTRRPPISPLFPSPPLFRSVSGGRQNLLPAGPGRSRRGIRRISGGAGLHECVARLRADLDGERGIGSGRLRAGAPRIH